MNEEVIDVFDEIINTTIIDVSNLGEKVVNGFFQGVLKVHSKR